MCSKQKGRAFCVILLAFLTFNTSVFTQTAPSGGFAEVGGGKLYYEMAGKGPAVVLIHGGLVDSRLWDNQFSVFAKHFTVVRYDLRGFGKSDFPTDKFSHVDDLYSLIKFLKIEKVSLIELSLGGIIAAEFTVAHPEMAEKLVLTSSGIRAGAKTPRNAQSAAIYKAAEEQGKQKAIELWLQHPFFASGVRKRVYREKVTAMLSDNYKYWGPTPQVIQLTWPPRPTFDRLGDIKQPTLIVAGDKDAPEIITVAGMLLAGIHGAARAIVRGTSHHLVMEKPHKYNRLVLKFLQKS